MLYKVLPHKNASYVLGKINAFHVSFHLIFEQFYEGDQVIASTYKWGNQVIEILCLAEWQSWDMTPDLVSHTKAGALDHYSIMPLW